jgi:hypothetical protein
VSAVGAFWHEAKNAMATRAGKLAIAETVFIYSSSEIWLRDFLAKKQHLRLPNQHQTHAYID